MSDLIACNDGLIVVPPKEDAALELHLLSKPYLSFLQVHDSTIRLL